MQPALLVWAICAAVLSARAKAVSPPVTVRLRTSWPASDLLLEVLESVSTENPDAFFPLLDVLTDPESQPPGRSLTPEAIYHAAVETAVSHGFLSEPGALESVELAVALHTSTPKLEAFYQYFIDRHALDPDCASWVDWYGERVCDLETLTRLAGHDTIDATNTTSTNSFPRPKILPFDHIHPSPTHTLDLPPRTAVFYASPTSPNFRALHSYLLTLSSAESPRLEYVFRYAPSVQRNIAEKSHLSGYGVILDLKKTDYLAVDDRRSHRQDADLEDIETDGPSQSSSSEDPILALIDSYPEQPDLDLTTPLTEEELSIIGFQATQLIANSSAPLTSLAHLSQDFPKYATSLARRVAVHSNVSDAIYMNHAKVQGGVNMVWLNGFVVPEADMNPFGLLRLLRKERATMLGLTSLGLSTSQAVELITHPAIGRAQSESGVLDGLVDASDRAEGGNVIVWWNDIEKDSRYSTWGSSLMGLLRPLYPGQAYTVKQNLFNVVLALDLSQSSSLFFIVGPVSNIINRGFPFRFGIAPIVETEEGAQMARLFYFLIEHYGRATTMGFLRRVSRMNIPIELLSPTVDWGLVRNEYESLIATEPPQAEDIVTDFCAVIGSADINGSKAEIETEEKAEAEPEAGSGENPLSARVENADAYTRRLAATLSEASQGHAFVNGRHFDMDDDFLRNMQSEFSLQTQHLQEQVYTGKIQDSDDQHFDTYFYDLPSTVSRRSRYIYPTSKAGNLRILSLPDLFSQTGFRVSADTFVYPLESEHTPMSIYVVADLYSTEGLALVKEALLSMEANSSARISFIHNPVDLSRKPFLISNLLVQGSLSKIAPSDLLQHLAAYPAVDDASSGFEHLEAYIAFLKSSRLVARELGLAPGQQAVLVNGRLVGPVEPNTFFASDFIALESYEARKRVDAVVEALQDVLSESDAANSSAFADTVSMASSIVSAIQLPDPSEVGLFNAPQRPRLRNYRLLDRNLTGFEFGDNSTALYHFGILLDPLTEAAQKWSSLLKWLSTIPSVFCEIHLNPVHLREVPLKRFYRYNLVPRLAFDELGSERRAEAVFGDLPVEPIYTLGMDVPPSWLVRPREAQYDLDNIQLSAVSSADRATGVEATFELDYLVVEGHARDVATHAPPRGLQLQLTTSNSTVVDDTQVVANLGYFQFKAKPGVFQLEIREGRGRDIFVMDSVGNEGWNSPNISVGGDEVTVTSFDGLTLYPRMWRIPGMERADVLLNLDDIISRPVNGLFDNIVAQVISLWNSVSPFKPEAARVEVVKGQADINIFTVASGLLYERFVGIMILSVLRNTKSSVKFWFIENFLSPSFLEFIPHLAEAYGFQYELVTYKWPSWLRAQKEKQRVIWAYKILFLDVLFPMDLKKVIFVDADQIVRTDLQELVDLDLEGAPYGYTPMGDDNEEMEGFRFWKTGYWKEFLDGRPYHISALYVVDLVRFRQMAAGDMLRSQYQALSADPNSLSNLDQDLPNNLQREVPIFSLHEDWLWCETWCSKDRLHRAKTIDLCQNPLTKEPKLARARQIPEWEVYDSEISRFARKLAEDGLIRSHLATADVNALANAGSAAMGAKATEEKNPVEEVEEPVPRDEL